MEIENNYAEKKTSRKTKKKEESEEEVSSDEEQSNYEPSHSEESIIGSSSEEEMSESEKVVLKKKDSSLKRKRGIQKESKAKPVPEKIKPPTKRLKKEDDFTDFTMPTQAVEGEKAFKISSKSTPAAPAEGEKSYKEKKEGSQRKPPNFDLGRVDFNLHTEDPNNIIQKTVQISTGLKLTCKMLAGATVSSGKVTYPDWAALIFQKKIKDDKCFEFNVGLKDAPKLIEGLKYIIAENKTFFNS